MEVQTERVRVGHQLPAHGMENENVEVERAVEDAQGMEDRNERVEGAPQLPAHGMELQERVARAEDEEEEEVEAAVEQVEAAGVEFLLVGRALPDLPPPTPGAGEEEGWQAIHRLGGTDSFLCKFLLLVEVPEQHKSAWARGYGAVLRRWREAATEQERDTALLWLGFLPQALLRKSVGRGGRKGRDQVAYRFTCLIEGNWWSLVELWERDREKERREGREEEGKRTWRRRGGRCRD